MQLLTTHGTRLLFVSLAFGALFVLAFLRLGSTVQIIVYAPVLLALALAAIGDLHCRRIPNWLTVLGLGWALISSMLPGVSRLQDAGLGALCCGGLLLVVAVLSRGAIGGGDVKLGGMIGAALGVTDGFQVLLAAQLIAALIALPLLLAGQPRARDLPFGPFLAFPAFLVLILRT